MSSSDWQNLVRYWHGVEVHTQAGETLSGKSPEFHTGLDLDMEASNCK